jgi:hypothetical protein
MVRERSEVLTYDPEEFWIRMRWFIMFRVPVVISFVAIGLMGYGTSVA